MARVEPALSGGPEVRSVARDCLAISFGEPALLVTEAQTPFVQQPLPLLELRLGLRDSFGSLAQLLLSLAEHARALVQSREGPGQRLFRALLRRPQLAESPLALREVGLKILQASLLELELFGATEKLLRARGELRPALVQLGGAAFEVGLERVA